MWKHTWSLETIDERLVLDLPSSNCRAPEGSLLLFSLMGRKRMEKNDVCVVLTNGDHNPLCNFC